jgi:hypothetical protein
LHSDEWIGAVPILPHTSGRVMKVKPILSISVAVVISACASVHTSATTLDPGVRLAKTCPLGVRIYTAPDRVASGYREVALLNSTADVKYSDEGRVQTIRRLPGHVVT